MCQPVYTPPPLQVEKINYIGVLLTTKGRMEQEINSSKSNAVDEPVCCGEIAEAKRRGSPFTSQSMLFMTWKV